MNNLAFPLKVSFKIGTLSNDFTVVDANASILAYVRQKLFKFVEHIEVFKSEDRTEKIYDIRANKWIDFSATYNFTKADGTEVGRVARQGMRSLWKARYQVFDKDQNLDFEINEENGWVKVFDSILGEIPLLGIFTGYFFNPSYIVKRSNAVEIFRITKEASFFGRNFKIDKLAQLEEGEEERIVLSTMMLLLLERQRG